MRFCLNHSLSCFDVNYLIYESICVFKKATPNPSDVNDA